MENKYTTTMNNNSTHAQAGGVVMGICAYLMHVDWSHVAFVFLNSDTWQMTFDFSIQLLKVGAAGFVGGAAGKLGGKLIEKFFPKKKRTTKSHN